MSRLLIEVAVTALSLSLLVDVAASGRSQAQSTAGSASVAITGWGNVTLSRGFVQHRIVRCTSASCPAEKHLIQRRRIVLTATPYKGWKFAGWHGACKGTKRGCAIDVARLHPDARGKRHVRTGATFFPAGPGWTPEHPIPLGATGSIGHGYHVRVNSVLPNVQLSPAAPEGKAYFAANVTVSFARTRTSGEGDVGSLVWTTMINHGDGSYSGFWTVTSAGDPPYPAPQPPLDDHHPLYPGHSTTGYLCWTVAASAATDINELAATVSTPVTRDTWFALR